MFAIEGPGLLQQTLESLASDAKRLPPCNIAPPELVGTAEIGATVSARPGIWGGHPVPKAQTTLFVGGVPRRVPCLLKPEDDGKEIVVTDIASNGVGEAVASSLRIRVKHPLPRALDVPADVTITSEDGTAVVEAGSLFAGTSGGIWSATCAADANALDLDIDVGGRLTLGLGTLSGSATVSVSYTNSGGSSSTSFVVSYDEISRTAPDYDGTLGDVSIVSGSVVSIEAGLAFSGDGLVYAVSGLPAGIVATSETGLISGQATEVGRYKVTVVATNSAGSAEGAFQFEITEPVVAAPTYDGSLSALTVLAGTAVDVIAGSAFTGEDLTFAATGQPQGVAIDAATGRIAGSSSTAGTFDIIVTASNAGGSVSGTFPLTVAEPLLAAPTYDGSLAALTVLTDTAVDVIAGSAFTGEDLTFAATGLPQGLTIYAATGRIAGQCSKSGTFYITVTASNAGGSVSGTFSLIVAEPVVVAPTYDGSLSALTVLTDTALDIIAGSAFTGEDLTFAATGLPQGLTIYALTGRIAGQCSKAGTFDITVTASNAGGSVSGTFPLTVAEPVVAAPTYDGSLSALTVLTDTAVDIIAGSAFTGEDLTFAALGLPQGLAIDAAGRIAGSYSKAGTFDITVTASNAGGSVSGTFSLVVAEQSEAKFAAPTYDGGASDLQLASNVPMTPVDLSVHFTGAEIVYTATGLPKGLSINANTGRISGTPLRSESAPVVVLGTNSCGSAQAIFNINVDVSTSGGGGDPDLTKTASIQSTALANNAGTATVGIGTDVAGRNVYFSVLAGGTTTPAFKVNGGTTGLSLVAQDAYTARAVQAYRATGLAGVTAGISYAGTDSEYLAAFKVIGYQPISSNPWKTGRRTGNDALTTVLNTTVPAGGAVLLHGKKYDGLSGYPAGTVIEEAATDALRGYWINTTGAAAAVSFTFTTSTSRNEKYAAALIMELI